MVKVEGWRSTSRRAHALNAAAEPSPIAATLARTSFGESSLAASMSTVARLVIVIHSKWPAVRSFSAAVKAADRAGISSIAGATMVLGPALVK